MWVSNAGPLFYDSKFSYSHTLSPLPKREAVNNRHLAFVVALSLKRLARLMRSPITNSFSITNSTVERSVSLSWPFVTFAPFRIQPVSPHHSIGGLDDKEAASHPKSVIFFLEDYFTLTLPAAINVFISIIIRQAKSFIEAGMS